MNMTLIISLKYDTDGSGKIEFPEFCNMMSHKMSYAEVEIRIV